MYAKDGIGFFSAAWRLLKTLVKKGDKGEKSFLRIFAPRVLDYLRPGFHPDELDNQYLIEQWIKDYESGRDMTNINVLDYSYR